MRAMYPGIVITTITAEKQTRKGPRAWTVLRANASASFLHWLRIAEIWLEKISIGAPTENPRIIPEARRVSRHIGSPRDINRRSAPGVGLTSGVNWCVSLPARASDFVSAT